jgi:deoxyribose-phosphate aldolase
MENENLQSEVPSDEVEFKEYKRLKRQEEALAMINRIEYDYLSRNIDKATLKNACRDFEKVGLGAVVVLPVYVKACVNFLGKDPSCALIAAISYPHGGDVIDIKVDAVKRAVRDGVDEVEVCAPLAAIKDGNYSYFKKECKKLKKAARHRALRIVIDCASLTESELTKACQCATDCGVVMLRLNNMTDSELLSRLKTAVKDKCLFKVDGGNDYTSFQERVVKGAQAVSCKNALDLAIYISSQIDSDI